MALAERGSGVTAGRAKGRSGAHLRYRFRTVTEVLAVPTFPDASVARTVNV
jgi:hypothetical protein